MRWTLPALFFTILVISVWLHPQGVSGTFAGEQSVATFLSAASLLTLTVLCWVKSFHDEKRWLVFSLFFFIALVDEVFMLHEHIKDLLIFKFPEHPHLFHESATLVSGIVGAVVCVMLVRQMQSGNKKLIYLSALAGAGSLFCDVLSLGIIPEEILKLVAELVAVYVLSGEFE